MTWEELQNNLLVIDSSERLQDTEMSEHLAFPLIHLQLSC